MAEATLVATLVTPPSEDGRELAGLPPQVGVLEVRADAVGDLGVDWLRDRFPGRLLYTLRSRTEAGGVGGFGGSLEERAERLARAAGGYDLVDLEGERDDAPELLAAVPAERRLVSWHGPSEDVRDLEARFARLARIPARFYKLVPRALQPGQEVPPLELLATLERRDVVAFASGEQGVWTRFLAPRLGGPLVYGAAGETPAAAGQPTVARLVEDYGLPALPAVETVFGIVGHPVSRSLSPRLHNGAYRELGIPALYLPFGTESFGDFWLEVVESPIVEGLGAHLRGFSVTAPFKRSALAVAGATSPFVECIGAANTLVRRHGVWEAESTDPDGVVLPLERRGVPLAGARAAVFGCGGAGRAAAMGLVGKGASVTLVNRGRERGEEAAELLELPFVSRAEVDVALFDLLVNATPLGSEDGDELPFEPERLAPGAVVVDMVYRGGPTPLVAAVRTRGGLAVEGREMLLFQALAQFRLMTGRELPLALGRRLLGLAGEEQG